MPPMLVQQMNNDNQEDKPLQERLDFTRPDFVFVPKEFHEWRQKGFFLECKSCDLVHAIYIGGDKLLVGLDEEGKPLFKNRS